MPYEIPKNLKYEEKIAFGLSLPKLFWLALFGSSSAIVFLKTNIDFNLKIVISVFLMALGISFAFLNLLKHLNTFRNYSKGIKEAGYFDSKLKSFVEVKKIEDETIYLQGGGLRAVLEVTPINFNILSEQEQKAVINAYKDFLNSLDFTVQIVMRTTSLNIDDYLFDLKKTALESNNPKIEEQFESFQEFIQNFIKENSIKNRLFYVVVPYSPHSNAQPLKDIITRVMNLLQKKSEKTSIEMNRSNALNQLSIRAKLCEGKLKKCGLFVKRLDDEQILPLLASFFDSYIHASDDYFSPMTLLKKFEGGDKSEARN